MNIKKFWIFLLLVTFIIIIAGCDFWKKRDDIKYSIAIFKIVQHPAIDAMQDSFKTYLENTQSLKGQVEFKVYNAGGESSEVSRLADLIVAKKFSLAYVLGTPCALALKEKTTTLPIVLGGATDPVATKLVKTWNKPGGNITGTTDLPPFDKHLEVLKLIMPNSSRIGVIYNDKEPNSLAAVAALSRIIAKEKNFSIVQLPVRNPQDIKSTILGSARKIDVLCIPTDNLLQSNFKTVMAGVADAKIPSFNCDRASAEKGAVFSVAVEYADIGVVSAKMAKKILVDGLNPRDMAIRSLENPQIYINRNAAEKFGISLPRDVATWAEVLN